MQKPLVALVALLSGFSFSVQAESWPQKPIRMVVGYPAGGGVDLVARIVGERLSDALKQPVIVENRSGASGAIGANAVVKSAPDGYTFLLASPAEVLVSAIAGQDMPYDSQRDLIPVALVGETPLAIVANSSTAARDLPEYFAYAKNHGGKLSYGTPGSGSSMHFAGEALKALSKIDMLHVPYRGAAPAVNDLLGEQLTLGIIGMPPVIQHHKSGTLRILAVTTKHRSSALPDVPTVAEIPGFTGYQFTNWMGIYAPANTSKDIITRLSGEVTKVVHEPSVQKKLALGGVEAVGMNAAQFASFLQEERKRYQAVASEQKIKVQD